MCGILYDILAPGAGYVTCGAARCQYRRESDTRARREREARRNPEYKAQQGEYAKAAKQRINDRLRERYRTDVEYREARKLRARNRYRDNAEYREKAKAASREVWQLRKDREAVNRG